MPCLSFPFTNLLGTHSPCCELWRWFWRVHVLWWPTGLSPNNNWVTGIPRSRDAKRRKPLPGSHSQVEETDIWSQAALQCDQHSAENMSKLVSDHRGQQWLPEDVTYELEPERRTSMNHSYWILTTTRHGAVRFVHFLSCKPHYSHTRSTIGHPLPTFS